MTNRERMQQALANKPAAANGQAKPQAKAHPPVTPPPQPNGKRPKPAKPKRPTPLRRDEIERGCRYPDGTTLTATYANLKWAVTVDVPGHDPMTEVHSGVHECLTRLWKRWTQAQKINPLNRLYPDTPPPNPGEVSASEGAAPEDQP